MGAGGQSQRCDPPAGSAENKKGTRMRALTSIQISVFEGGYAN